MASATASAPAPAPAPASPPSSAAANRSQQQHRVHAEEDQQQQQQTQQERDRLQRTPRLDLQRVAGAGLVLGLLLAVMCVNGQIDGYTAGVDYPVYETVPKGLSFSCQGRVPGYYADTETRCQVWHWCLHSGHQYSFLCPNGTVFNQAVRVCDWWSNVNCPGSEQLYLNNDDLYRQAAEKAGEDI